MSESQKWSSTAGPRQTKAVEKALKDLRWRGKARVEISGVVGGEEYRSTLVNVCGAPSAAFADAWQELGEAFNWSITRENHKEVIVRAELLTKNLVLPIDDQRKTPEQVEAQNKIIEEAQGKRDEQEQAFYRHYAAPEPITVNAGDMIVTVGLKYDNSDSMTDYFDRNASYSPVLVAAVVKQQAEKEALARRVVARYPELRDFDWSWHTEKYSMGHGNYLDGEYIDLPEELQGFRNYYGQPGGPVKSARWQVEFNKYGSAGQYRAFRGYPGEAAALPEPQAVSEVTVTENAEKSGIEIRFPERPPEATLSTLKAHGWRWSRYSKCWYHRADDEARAFAAKLAS